MLKSLALSNPMQRTTPGCAQRVVKSIAPGTGAGIGAGPGLGDGEGAEPGAGAPATD
jgi:hypothetical protein